MKPITISLAILSTLLIFSLLTSSHISSVVDQTSSYLEDALLETNRSQSVRLVSDATAYWKENQTCFGLLLRHDEIDEVICEMALLQAYAEQEDWDDFDGNCAGLLARLQHIKEMEQFSLQNIF